MIYRILITITALLLSLTAYSGPARKGLIYMSQPDGTSIEAYIQGDEFMKITTTREGHALIQESDGWWCYATYDGHGRKHSTGRHAGSDIPREISVASRIIPYSAIAAAAERKRTVHNNEEEPLMARIMGGRKAAAVKGDDVIVKHGLIILAQFKDEKFSHSREDFVNMLTRSGYSLNGATGSAKEYFDAQFSGAVDFRFDVSSIVTLPEGMAFYGKNDSDDSDIDPAKMIVDACRLADAETDFSLYDDDGDGDEE